MNKIHPLNLTAKEANKMQDETPPMLLPDLANLAKMGDDIAKWSAYLEKAGAMHVANLQSQIKALEADADMLMQEHAQAVEHVNLDYQRKMERNVSMRDQLMTMLEFYTKQEPKQIAAEAKDITPIQKRRGFFRLT